MYIKWIDGKPYNKHGDEIQFLSDRKINEFHTHLDTLEEYEEDSIVVDYGDFLRFMEDCPSFYATTNDNEKYLTDWAKKRKLYPRRYHLANALAKGILEQDFNPKILPLIPIVEYKLVPTGNVTYYDPLSQEYDRVIMKVEEEQEVRRANKVKKKNIWQRHADRAHLAQIEGGRLIGKRSYKSVTPSNENLNELNEKHEDE